jgi:hypothetical protein
MQALERTAATHGLIERSSAALLQRLEAVDARIAKLDGRLTEAFGAASSASLHEEPGKNELALADLRAAFDAHMLAIFERLERVELRLAEVDQHSETRLATLIDQSITANQMAALGQVDAAGAGDRFESLETRLGEVDQHVGLRRAEIDERLGAKLQSIGNELASQSTVERGRSIVRGPHEPFGTRRHPIGRDRPEARRHECSSRALDRAAARQDREAFHDHRFTRAALGSTGFSHRQAARVRHRAGQGKLKESVRHHSSSCSRCAAAQGPNTEPDPS